MRIDGRAAQALNVGCGSSFVPSRLRPGVRGRSSLAPSLPKAAARTAVRLFVAWIGAVTMAAAVPVTSLLPADPVAIPDPNLRAAIEAALGMTNPTESDMLRLEVLVAPNAGIADLTGLEYAKNLVLLSVPGNRISDLDPLTGLTLLQGLDLSFNDVSDIGPVSGLTSIYSLSLQANRIENISALAGLSSLNVLDLRSNRIRELGPLSSLASVTQIFLASNDIVDLGPLSVLAHLEYLDAASNRIEDVSPLSDLPALGALWLSHNRIGDISPLAGLAGLYALSLESNRIGDISAVAGMTQLRVFDASSNQVGEIQSLSGHTALTDLRLNLNHITDIRPLSGLSGLTVLTLEFNAIEDISPLAGMSELTFLGLEGNGIHDLGPLASMAKLEIVGLFGNRIEDIGPLAGLQRIRFLSLSDNPVTDISALSGLTALEELQMSHCLVTDLGPLAALTRLRVLYAPGNRITDVLGLLGLRELQAIVLTGNPLDCEAYCAEIPALISELPALSYIDPSPDSYGYPVCDANGSCDQACTGAADPDRLCDDGNGCTVDACDLTTGRCSSTPLCDDHNPCTDDVCDLAAASCHHTDNTAPCNDGNACTRSDTCSAGTCVGADPVVCAVADDCHLPGVCDPASGACTSPERADGTSCDDGDLCTGGETCRSGVCTPAFDGLTEPNPRTNGYYKRLCQGPHSGDALTDADASCVAGLAPAAFGGVTTVDDLCAVLAPATPNGDACGRSEDDLLVLTLNVCRARVCVQQGIDSQCGSNTTVGRSLAEAEAIFADPNRTFGTCGYGKCITEEINTGRALDWNSLRLARAAGGGTTLLWSAPYLDDGASTGAYKIWRRPHGTGAFVRIATVSATSFTDPEAGSFDYEVTAVTLH